MTESAPHTLLLIDASNWLFRAYHALPPLTSPQGEPTGAIYGFASMLKRLQREHHVDRVAVVFDASGTSFRNDIYPEYKANRSETPEDLSAQFPAILDLVKGLGLPLLMEPGVEADDVIGTLARQGEALGMEVLIVTGDKDMAQLVSERVNLLDTMKNRRMGPAGVVEKFGVHPEQIIDYLALMGDAVDNIPGVPGVGEKTAAKLLKEHGTLEGVIAAAPTVKGKLGENLRGALDTLPMCRVLATIKCDVALPVALDTLRKGAENKEQLATLYRRLGFHRWVEELGAAAAASLPPPLAGEGRDGGVSGAPLSPQALPSQPPPASGGRSDSAAELPASQKTQATLVVDEAVFAEMLAALEAAELICFDTETDSLESNRARLVGLAFAVEAGKGWYLPLAHDYLGAPAQLPAAEVLARLKPLLEDPAKAKVGQHAKFDCNVLALQGIQVRGLAYDTMLESYVLDAAGNRHDMDTLAEKYLGHKTIAFSEVAGKGKNQITFNQVALDIAAAYSAEDADITLRLHQTLYPRLAETPSLLAVFERLEMPLVPVLAAMEQTGVKVDAAMLAKISGELALRMAELQAQAYAEAGTEFNLGSPKQLQELLYGKLGLPVLAKTPKGDPSTAEDVLEDLAAQHPLPRLILDWRSVSKLRSTYTETLPLQINPRTGRIHTSYHQAVAATGRLSSQDPNLQNIPVRNAEGRRIRHAFVSEPGKLLCSIDYSQIELRLMAHFSGDAKLVEAFQSGKDIHQATAAEVFGLSLDAVSSDQRRAAKAINFGLIYGMSSWGLAKQLAIGRAEAQDYIDRFFARYPGVKRFMDDTKSAAKERGYVETLFGRRLYLPNINSKNQGLRQYAERTAINAPLQGTAADLIKAAMIDLHAYLSHQAPAVKMIMQVHDELVFEAPAEQMSALAPELARRMVRVLHEGAHRPAPLAVPLVADFGIGDNWESAHTASGHASA
ncbi:DNA polymerase I [Stagnimonas aquatica]|uniref:DNA polymerase I n=1 Tax=Stagnimonas aquatica TaxID=2689987 RepID=A0A3N0VM10_9GAMM|nr:DNA polymerase I [Stagnimonas aquatica]ROH93785.1 DNA polymerase I [Stagnimonas aquatica]